MNIESGSNVAWHHADVTRDAKQARDRHRGGVIWLTGLSGAGETTLAHTLGNQLFDMGCQTVVLDGDNVPHGLCSNLSFSVNDRKENIRRIGEVAKLFAEASIIAVTTFILRFREDREIVRGLMPHGDFIEVYVECPLEICEQRDVKALYNEHGQGKFLPTQAAVPPTNHPRDQSAS